MGRDLGINATLAALDALGASASGPAIQLFSRSHRKLALIHFTVPSVPRSITPSPIPESYQHGKTPPKPLSCDIHLELIHYPVTLRNHSKIPPPFSREVVIVVPYLSPRGPQITAHCYQLLLAG